MINTADLCQYAQSAVGGGYCWGADGQVCSLSLRQELARRAPDQATNLLNLCAKWDGRKVWDCSGLFRGAWRALSAYKSGGATTIYRAWCKQTGTIDTLPEAPGTALFHWSGKDMNHIGLYIGEKTVIHAKGSAYGVIREPMQNYPWTHWGQPVDVAYGEGAPAAPEPAGEEALYLASVVNVKTGLNFRTAPVNSTNTILLIPLDGVVEVLQDNCGNGFAKVRYCGIVGYATRRYLLQM